MTLALLATQEVFDHLMVLPHRIFALSRKEVYLRGCQAQWVIGILAGSRVDRIALELAFRSFLDVLLRCFRQSTLEISGGFQVEDDKLQLIASLNAPPSVGLNCKLLFHNCWFARLLKSDHLSHEGKQLIFFKDLVVCQELGRVFFVHVPEKGVDLVHDSCCYRIESRLRCTFPVVVRCQSIEAGANP